LDQIRKQAESKQKVARENKALLAWEEQKPELVKKYEEAFFNAMGKHQDALIDADDKDIDDEDEGRIGRTRSGEGEENKREDEARGDEKEDSNPPSRRDDTVRTDQGDKKDDISSSKQDLQPTKQDSKQDLQPTKQDSKQDLSKTEPQGDQAPKEEGQNPQ